jgi:hypothetical protein
MPLSSNEPRKPVSAALATANLWAGVAPYKYAWWEMRRIVSHDGKLTKPLLTTLAAEPYPICVLDQKELMSMVVEGMGPEFWEITWYNE